MIYLVIIFSIACLFRLVLMMLNIYVARRKREEVEDVLYFLWSVSMVMALYMSNVQASHLFLTWVVGMVVLSLMFKVEKKWSRYQLRRFVGVFYPGISIIVIHSLFYQVGAWVWGLTLSVTLLSLILYKLYFKKLVHRYFTLTPYKMPFDETLNTIDESLNNALYMVKGKNFYLPMNALFTSLYKGKRVMMSEKLISRLNSLEVKAIILHEFGHYKHNHLRIRVVLLVITVMVYTLVLQSIYGFNGFGEGYINQFMALIFLGYPLSMVGEIIVYRIAQIQEYQADDYVINNHAGEALFRALYVIGRAQGMSHKHPLYQWFFESHPRFKKRLITIHQAAKLDPSLLDLL